jgi:predicted transcriptional regulator/ribosome-associated translation inhibitor RaiA
MEIKRTLILDSSDSLSKALPQLDMMPAVIVTKGGKYFGIIDHRSISQGMRVPQNVKCESAVLKPPVLTEESDIMQRVDAFLLGHYKALPVCDREESPLGVTTRIELLKELVVESLIPQVSVSDLMSSPAYTIEGESSVGKAKNALKDKKTKRLVVTSKGNIVGVVSAFDIGVWSAKPNLLSGGRKDIRQGEQINIDDMMISQFLRPDITRIPEGASLEEAARRMIDKGVSSVVVVSGKKPLGVLAAVDIFKKIKEMSDEGMQITISGLDQDSMSHYAHIRNRIGHALEKFGKSFSIRNCSVHVKEGKSTFVVSVYFDLDRGHVSLKREKDSLRETVDEVAAELVGVLRKKKELRSVKPRVTHAR